MFDKILYINLAHREDRRIQIGEQMQKIGWDPKNVIRVEGVLEKMCGHLGCGKSHVKALELAIKNDWDSVLILEDDFVFNDWVNKETFKSFIENLYTVNWDVTILARGHHEVKKSEYEWLERVITCTTTSGYIVKKHYYKKLLNVFSESVKQVTKELKEHTAKCKKDKVPVSKLDYCSAIDQYWFGLQSTDTFYLFKSDMGRQESWSDNNCSIEHQAGMIEEYKANK